MSDERQNNTVMDMGWGGELVKAFEEFAKFTWQSVVSNTLGNQKPSEALAKIFTGEFDANDRDAALAHTFSNHVKVLAALQRTVRAEMRIAQLAAEPIENAKNAIAKLNTEAFNAIHGLAESKNNILTNLEVVEEKIKASATDVEKTAWQKFKQLNLNRLEQVNNEIADIAKQHSLAIDKIDSPKTILDKIAGNHTYGEKYFAAISTLFNYANFARLVLNYNNVMKNGNEEDLFNYTAGWVNYVSTLSPTKAAGWFASVDKWLDVVIDEKLLANIANASRKAILSGAARGLVTGILMDISYKVGYKVGERIWGDVFKGIYGVTAYEYYADEFDALYSTIFQHSSGSELNAVIAFNTMILSRFVNQQRESVIKEDSADLFGADDYKEISFAKVLFTYKKLYRAVTGKNDAEQLTDAAAMMAHMESAYPAFKEFSGTKLLVLTKEQNEELLKQANRPDEYGMAARYALQNLNPFMLLGEKVDYRKFSPHGELDLYSADNPNGMTEGYLKDRLEMLKQQNDFFVHNVSGSKRFGALGLINSPETAHALRNMDDVLYEDFSANGGKGLQLDINYKNMPESVKQHISFGTNQNDDKGELTGGSKNDRLYGLAGDDTLKGLGGSDHMEGGIGFDTYHIEDEDTVFDSDGKGKLVFKNGKTAGQFERIADQDGVWRSEGMQAIRQGNDLKVSADGDSATIQNFFVQAAAGTDGSLSLLGITLADAVPTEERPFLSAITYTGEANLYNTFNLSGQQRFNIIGGSKDDLVFANGTQAARIDAGAGNDRIYGSYGADTIYGGSGSDYINGSPGVIAGTNRTAEQQAEDRDFLVGGAGRDVVVGMAGDDIIHTGEVGEHLLTAGSGEAGDVASGGLGDDKIYGSIANDLLAGSEGGDTVYGGAGDDVILGDALYRLTSRSLTVYQESTITGPEYGPGIIGTGYIAPPSHHTPRVGMEHNYSNGKWAHQVTNVASRSHPDMEKWTVSIDREKGDYAFSSPIPATNEDHRLAAGGGADYLYGGYGNDLIIGQDGNDFLYGESGNDILWGDDNRDLSVAGDDYLDGGDDNDTLYGGGGTDTLIGGRGSDTLYGGTGFDTYLFHASDLKYGNDIDTIDDEDGQGRIVIDGTALDGLTWQRQDGGWRSGRFSLSQTGSELHVAVDGWQNGITVRNFANGTLGLNLPAQQPEPPAAQPKPETPNPRLPETPALPDLPAETKPQEPSVNPDLPETPILPTNPSNTEQPLTPLPPNNPGNPPANAEPATPPAEPNHPIPTETPVLPTNPSNTGGQIPPMLPDNPAYSVAPAPVVPPKPVKTKRRLSVFSRRKEQVVNSYSSWKQKAEDKVSSGILSWKRRRAAKKAATATAPLQPQQPATILPPSHSPFKRHRRVAASVGASAALAHIPQQAVALTHAMAAFGNGQGSAASGTVSAPPNPAAILTTPSV